MDYNSNPIWNVISASTAHTAVGQLLEFSKWVNQFNNQLEFLSRISFQIGLNQQLGQQSLLKGIARKRLRVEYLFKQLFCGVFRLSQ